MIQKLAALGALASMLVSPTAFTDDFQRLYGHMIDANKAQVIMLHEQGLLDDTLASELSAALIRAESEWQSSTGETDYPNYLHLESRLAELVGEETSNIHIGRSRNDLGATMNLMILREHVLDLLQAIAGIRGLVQEMAAENIGTVVPGYTHAVQAQPTTLAHLLLAFDASLQRDSDRLREVYGRINRSPLGAGAFTTSGFYLDRDRLAELLGFPALVENAYDAITLNPADTKMELASVVAISAMSVGRLAQYILFQYEDPAPGLFLSDDITGRSSIMPQKRSPSPVERLRLAASEVIGMAHTSTLLVHNTPMYEVKEAREDHVLRSNTLVATALIMYDKLDAILRAITVRPDVLLAKVDSDYSTMTELADTLKRDAGVPFRVGHEVASELTTYGRMNGKTPSQLSYGEVAEIYREVTGETLPLNEEQIRRTFDAKAFVTSRKGKGGPQPAEARRMLADQQASLAATTGWTESETVRLEAAKAAMDEELATLID
ncbi:MAG: argininosuccinate lyase [Lysobacterales bacterium]